MIEVEKMTVFWWTKEAKTAVPEFMIECQRPTEAWSMMDMLLNYSNASEIRVTADDSHDAKVIITMKRDKDGSWMTRIEP